MVPPATQYLVRQTIQRLKWQSAFKDLKEAQWKRAEELTFDTLKKQYKDEPYLSNNHSVSSPAFNGMIEEMLTAALKQVRHRLF